MPPIVPPPSELLSAPAPEQSTTNIIQRPGPQTNAEQAPLAPSPIPSLSRRLTIYYQNKGDAPVVPTIDNEIDIAQPVLNQFAEYVVNRSQVNDVPINATQPNYIDKIANAKVEFNSVPTPSYTNDPIISTPDMLGVHYKANNGTGLRNFSINVYQKDINQENAKLHEANINRILLSTRGHNSEPNNQFVTPDVTQNKNDNRITLGSYFYKNASNLSNGVNYVSGSYVRSQPNTATSAPPMTIEQMKNIGLNIMFEAVQGRAGLDFAIRSNDAGDIAEAEARMVLPSEQRIGKRVSLGRFTPAFQIKKLTGAEKPNNSNFIDNTDDVQSYGSQYNVYSQFDSLISLGQIALCVAMILAYVLLLNTIVAFIHIRDTREGVNLADLNGNQRRRLLGSSILQKNSGVYPSSQTSGTDFLTQTSGFTELVGTNGLLPYTRYGHEYSLNAGIQEFFGFSFLGGSLETGITGIQQLANSSLKVLTENGRLNVILREILRSGISLVEDSSVDFTGAASIAGIGNLLKKISTLKIIRFIGVLMSMGDRVRFETEIRRAASLERGVASAEANSRDDPNFTPDDSTSFGANVSYIDNLNGVLRSNFISKSRISVNNTGIIWSNTSAGMAKLPLYQNNNKSSFAGAAGINSKFGSRWSDIDLPVNQPSFSESNIFGAPTISNEEVNNGRISPDHVREIEKSLEADFMPFYIHDLRTNEILSFHAFLEDANEDFNVEYTAQDGYGRMDKVQIYKGTTRNVSVNFKMVAMNPQDHDMMWYKINSLAMMIYPQWTQGRKVSIGQTYNFIQAFSQIPGATPVIRLRLGDLYKSNYSKMAVARLFGINTLEDYSVGNVTDRSSAQTLQENQPATTDIGRRRAALASSENINKDNINNIFALFDDLVLVNLPSNTSTPSSSARPRPSPRRRRNIQNNQNIRYAAKFVQQQEVLLSNDGTSLEGITVNVVQSFIVSDVNDLSSTTSVTGINNDNVFLPYTFLNSNLDKPRTLAKFDAKIVEETASNNARNQERALLDPVKFYNRDLNPVMKAFHSSGGKGLAGVITNFKVDYGEAKGNWGIDSSNSLRAPMFVTINLTMAVIHDITPGLDAKGVMMAPIWPVGNMSNYFMKDSPNRNQEGRVVPSIAVDSGEGLTDNNYFDVKNKVMYYKRTNR
jgi:hypothetical protein